MVLRVITCLIDCFNSEFARLLEIIPASNEHHLIPIQFTGVESLSNLSEKSIGELLSIFLLRKISLRVGRVPSLSAIQPGSVLMIRSTLKLSSSVQTTSSEFKIILTKIQ